MRTANAPPGLAVPLLAATAVSKRFGAVRALVDVDVEVRAGEILALAGENGSGKSTLAKLLAGIHTPDGGHILVDGAEHRFHRPRAALDAGIAIVTQELTAVPAMSLAENVLLPRLHRYLSTVARRRLAAEATPYLERVGLTVDPLLPFGALGPGQRELVEIAKALAASPRVLILDEATTRLPDPERLFALMESLSADGMAIIFITQRLREIQRVADRAAVLRDGRLAGELGNHELSEKRLTGLMVGRALHLYQKQHHCTERDWLVVDRLVTDRSPAPISFTVRAGEVVGLAGLVGSGRSELLETVAGTRRPRGGRVLVDGRPLRLGSCRTAMRAGIALVPEDRRGQGLVMDASVARNLAMSSWSVLGVARRKREELAATATGARLRIRAASVSAPVSTLSGGNQQKVVIGRCLMARPGILLLDEPTRGVDVGVREEIFKLIDELTHDGTAVVLASSDLPEILALSDRVIVLREGAVSGELSSREASEERILLLAAGHRPAMWSPGPPGASEPEEFTRLGDAKHDLGIDN